MEKTNVITITKTASAKIAADTVRISLSAVGEAKKYSEAVDKSSKTANAAISALGGVGIAQVRTLGVNVSAVREERKVVGYRATQTFSAEFDYDVKLLCAVMDALSGGECEWRVSFELKSKKESERLVAEAVTAAKKYAETIAKAAGVKLGALVKAECCPSDGECAPRPMLMRAAFDGANAMGATEPELITLSETVTCAWEVVG